MMTYQLPPEEFPSEMEQQFIEESPNRLWPENQDSYFGQFRATLVNPVLQTLSDQLVEMFAEMFALHSDPWLYRHERDRGIPTFPSGLSLEPRRERVMLRLRKGAFSRANRNRIVEMFIIATQSLGTPTSLTPDGIVLTAGGVTLYNEPVPPDVALFYTIVENIPNFSYEVNISPVLTPDIEGLTRELRHFTPAGISFILQDDFNYFYRTLHGYGAVSGYWRLGDTSGTTANDETANNNDGTYSGSFTLNQTGALTSDPDKAVRFQSTTGKITIPDSASLDVGDVFSLECWMKLGATGYNFPLFDKGPNGFQLVWVNGPFNFNKGTVAQIVQSSIGVSDTTTWHHIVVTKDVATTKIYIDGIDRTGPVTNQTIQNTATALTVGPADGAGGDIRLDEMAIYPRALTAAEVLSHYNTRVA